MQPRRLKIFLCHSSADKALARDLYKRANAQGFEPWLDAECLLPGQDWDYEIRKAVRASDVVIVCLSQDSITKEGYVQKEIKVALDVADEKPEGTIFIVPLRLDNCQVPDRLRRWQWVNFFETGGWEKLLLALTARSRDIARSWGSSGQTLAPTTTPTHLQTMEEEPVRPPTPAPAPILTLSTLPTSESATAADAATPPGPAPKRAALKPPWPSVVSSAPPTPAAWLPRPALGSRRARLTIGVVASTTITLVVLFVWMRWGSFLLTPRFTFVGELLTAEGKVNRITFSPEGGYLAAAARGKAFLWNLSTYEKSTIDPRFWVWDEALSRDGRLAVAGDGGIAVYDLQSGTTLIRTLPTGGVRAVAFSPDGRSLATCARDQGISIWDVTTGQKVQGLGPGVTCDFVAFSPDGRLLLSPGWQGSCAKEGGAENHIYVWKLDDTSQPLDIAQSCFGNGELNGAAFSPDGGFVATGRIFGPSDHQALKIFGLTTQREVLEVGTESTESVAFSPDGEWLVSGGGGGVELRHTRTGRLLQAWGGFNSSVTSVAVSTDGRSLATGTDWGQIKLWRGVSAWDKIFAHLQGKPSAAGTPKQTSGANSLSPTQRQSIYSFGPPFEFVRKLSHVEDGVHSLAFIPNSRQLLLGVGKAVEIWDVEKGKRLRTLPDGPGWIWALAPRPDAKQVAVAYSSMGNVIELAPNKQELVSPSVVHILDMATGQRQAVLAPRFNGADPAMVNVDMLAYSPDGAYLAAYGSSMPVIVWRAETQTQVYSWADPSENFGFQLAFSPDRRWLAASLSRNRTGGPSVKLWEAGNFREAKMLDARDVVEDFAFSPDGKWLATGSEHGGARLWDVVGGNQVRAMHQDGSYQSWDVNKVAFTPDGRWLAGMNDFGRQLQIWEIDTGALASTLHLPSEGCTGAETANFAFSPDGKWLVVVHTSANNDKNGSCGADVETWRRADRGRD